MTQHNQEERISSESLNLTRNNIIHNVHLESKPISRENEDESLNTK